MANLVSAAGAWRSRRVLVTGAGGFVGGHLTRRLLDEGADVVAVVRDPPSAEEAERVSLGGRARLVVGSVSDPGRAQAMIAEHRVEDIFHLAAQAIVSVANEDPVPTLDANVAGTWWVLEAARTTPGVERVVVASSDKAYGTQPVLPYTEEMPLLGRNPYDASKACADILAQTYAAAFGLNVVISRCANIYGGGDWNFSRLVPGTIRAALRGERPVIRSDGSPLRDYVHIDDAVQAYLDLAEGARGGRRKGRAYNFGANHPVTVLELTRMLLAAAGREDLEPDVRATASNEIDRQYLDSRRAREELGWSAAVSLEEGLRRTLDDYREHLARTAG
jgi:CDP-glucose 4,6-dehydratase